LQAVFTIRYQNFRFSNDPQVFSRSEIHNDFFSGQGIPSGSEKLPRLDLRI